VLIALQVPQFEKRKNALSVKRSSVKRQPSTAQLFTMMKEID